MALAITSANASSSSSSFGCIDNLPKPPSSVRMRPLQSSYDHSLNNLFPLLSSYPPMPHSKINHQYIPIDPPYLPQCQTSLPYWLGEDISRAGAGTWYIRIMAQEPTLVNIALHQDHTLSHYMQLHLPEDFIDPETYNVLMRCQRVGRVACLLWKEIILLFKACAPQWWWQWWWWNIWRVCWKVQSSWRRLGDGMRCREEGSHGNDSWDVFPLNIDGYCYDSFSWLDRHSLWFTHLILVQWLNSFVTLFPHISYNSFDE